jgi:hypothetical protein
MKRQVTGGMHVDRVRSRHTSKSGETHEYVSYLVRRSFRKTDGKVGKDTLANLSMLPPAAVDAIEAVLKGKTLVEAAEAVKITRTLPHGHVALAHAAAVQLGWPAGLGPPCRERDLGYALILSWAVRPASKLATLAWWDNVTLGPDLGVTGTSGDDLDEATDWLLDRQDAASGGLVAGGLAAGPGGQHPAAPQAGAGDRGQVLICRHAADLSRQLRAALAPVTSPPDNLRGLLDHLGTLSRSTIQFGGATFDTLSEPTPLQRRAFDLIAAPIPLALTLT